MVGGFILPFSEFFFKATWVKAIYHLCKEIQINDGTEQCLDTDSYLCGQLIFDESVKVTESERLCFHQIQLK